MNDILTSTQSNASLVFKNLLANKSIADDLEDIGNILIKMRALALQACTWFNSNPSMNALDTEHEILNTSFIDLQKTLNEKITKLENAISELKKRDLLTLGELSDQITLLNPDYHSETSEEIIKARMHFVENFAKLIDIGPNFELLLQKSNKFTHESSKLYFMCKRITDLLQNQLSPGLHQHDKDFYNLEIKVLQEEIERVSKNVLEETSEPPMQSYIPESSVQKILVGINETENTATAFGISIIPPTAEELIGSHHQETEHVKYSISTLGEVSKSEV